MLEGGLIIRITVSSTLLPTAFYDFFLLSAGQMLGLQGILLSCYKPEKIDWINFLACGMFREWA